MFVELIIAQYVLTEWKKAPNRSRRSYGRMSDWQGNDDWAKQPLSRADVQRYREYLKQHAPSHYKTVFPEEDTP